MGGLLTRALRLRKNVSKPASAPGQSDIPEDERRELVAEIEQIIAKARIPLAAGPMPVASRRQDLLLPILVNAGAILVICAAALIIPAVLGRRGLASDQGTGAGLVGEATLVGALKTESEQAVRKVQTSLQAALKERDNLAAGAETLVRRKQQELAASLNAELDAEKQRLRSEGATSAAIELQMRTVEQQKRALAERQLSDFQRQLDSQIAQKNAEIDALRAQTRGNQQEQDRMAALEARNQGEQMVLDQLTASYARVGDTMKAGRWEDARAALDALGSYLDQSAVAGLPAVSKRRAVDLFLIDSLRRLASSDSTPQKVASTPAVEQTSAPAGVSDAHAQAIAKTVADAIAAGNSLYAQGNYAGSLERYGAALQALRDAGPGVDAVAGRIADAGFHKGMADLAARQDALAKAALDRADALAAAGASSEAVAAYVTLIQSYPQSSSVDSATAGVRAVMGARAAAREKLQALTQALNDSARSSSSSAAAAQEELISLLQTKVDVRQILLSDPVHSQHPDLAAKLDRFLDLTAEVRREEGRAAAMKDAAAVIDSLGNTQRTGDLSPVIRQYSDNSLHSAFQRFLEALRGLFR